jgi:hypothetical protein
LEFIEKTATEADQEVGEFIATEIDKRVPTAEAILGQVGEEIKNQTLTKAKAQEYFGKLKILLVKLTEAVRDSIAELPESVANQIKGRLGSAQSKIESHAQNIYTLLEQ